MKTHTLSDDRRSRLIISVGVGVIVCPLVLLVALLVDDATHGGDNDSSTGRCAPAVVGTVDPVTCLPYGVPGAGVAPGTHGSGRSAQQPKAPAAKVPPAPAVKIPVAPRVRIK